MTTVQRSFAEAPALPFAPHAPGDPREIQLMLDGRFTRPNRKRYHYPSLAAAMVCLLASTTALTVTSRHVEAEITSWVPAVQQTVDQARTAMLGTTDHNRISFNSRDSR